jgi:hypothetical protein
MFVLAKRSKLAEIKAPESADPESSGRNLVPPEHPIQSVPVDAEELRRLVDISYSGFLGRFPTSHR